MIGKSVPKQGFFPCQEDADPAAATIEVIMLGHEKKGLETTAI